MAVSEYAAAAPPFTQCILVETKLVSRQNLRRALHESRLFETILEPVSLNEALGQLEGRDIDACFLGPTITRSRLRQFVKKAKLVDRTHKCAFFKISGDSEDVDDNFCQVEGVHGVIASTSAGDVLRKAVVSGVIAANKERVFRPADPKAGESTERELSQVFRAAAYGLKEILLRAKVRMLNQGDFAEDIVAAEVAHLLQHLLPERLLFHFEEHLQEAFTEWVLTALKTSAEIANTQLAHRLNRMLELHYDRREYM